jgi:hypothetical protein
VDIEEEEMTKLDEIKKEFEHFRGVPPPRSAECQTNPPKTTSPNPSYLSLCVVCGDKASYTLNDTVTQEVRGFCKSCGGTSLAVQEREARRGTEDLSGKGGAERMCKRGCGHREIRHRDQDCLDCGGLCI